jgi:type II secretory pathway pseudopilin PulG
MQTGSGCGRARRGFTYLGLLFVVTASAAALAVLGRGWHTAVLRDKERELIFRGRQIAQAITAYRAAPVAGSGQQWPRTLDDLVQDRRSAKPLHHLRRLYTDPFTGQPDWVMLAAPDGTLRGVHSRSDRPAFITEGLPAAPPGMAPKLSDRHFMAAGPPAVPAPASAPQSAPGTRDGREIPRRPGRR